jgi:hypothetical protein
MSILSRKFRWQRGQTLVWVAIALTVLMGAVALAVDVGSLYSERRWMQNAADAAALEAARYKCFTEPVPASSTAAARGATFATTNYPRPNAAALSYTVAPRTGYPWEFEATAVEQVRPWFAGVLGFGPTEVKATAAAACGDTDRACGVFPLAFSQTLWDGIETQCGKTFYVWTGDKENGGKGANPPNCTACDCTKVYDKKGDLLPGVLAVADSGRAWLDFTSAGTGLNPVDCGGNNGCGAAELKCWIDDDSNVIVLNNSCVSGTNGVKLGVKGNVNGRSGDYVNVPLFNARCAPAASPSGHTCDAQGFNISSFGCVQVVGLETDKKSLVWAATPTAPGKYCTATNRPNNCEMCLDEKMLEVKVGCDPATGATLCSTDCGKTSGGGAPGAGVRAVSLID